MFRYLADQLRRPVRSPLKTVITRSGWYFLVVVGLVFAGAMVRQVNLLLIFAGMLAAPLVLGAWATRRTLAGLNIRRRLPSTIAAGDLLVGQIEVERPRRGGAWGVLVEDRLTRLQADGSDDQVERVRVLFPYLPGRATRRGAYRGRLLTRGRYRAGPMRALTRFPFGLFRRRQSVGQVAALTVHPRLGRLRGAWDERRQEALVGTYRREPRQGPEGDFFGLRPWQTGDSLRHVHWRRTARVGSPVVRQFERPRNRDLVVVLDLWIPRAKADRAPDHEDNVELAVSFAATLLTERCRRGGSSVMLLVPGDSDDAPRLAPATPGLLAELMDRLAVVQPHSDDPLPRLLATAVERTAPGTEIAIVATRPVDVRRATRQAEAGGPTLESVARRARVVDTSSEKLDECFEMV